MNVAPPHQPPTLNALEPLEATPASRHPTPLPPGHPSATQGQSCCPTRARTLHPLSEARTRYPLSQARTQPARYTPKRARTQPAQYSPKRARTQPARYTLTRPCTQPARIKIALFTTLITAFTLLPLPAIPARASPPTEALTWRWPLHGQPRILRRFAPPPKPWLAGHRGIDLAAPVATPVLAAGPGTIRFAGPVAGKGVVTIDHPNGLRTTYLPVKPSVSRGHQVTPGTEIGVIDGSKPHCPESCLHWGLIRDAHYLNPLHLLGHAPTRLLPFWPQAGNRFTHDRSTTVTPHPTAMPSAVPQHAPIGNTRPFDAIPRQITDPFDAVPRQITEPSDADLHRATKPADSHPSFTALAHHSPVAGALPALDPRALPTPSTSTTKQTIAITPPATAPNASATATTQPPANTLATTGERWPEAEVIRLADSAGDTASAPLADVRSVRSSPNTQTTAGDIQGTETALDAPTNGTGETRAATEPQELTTKASKSTRRHPQATTDTPDPIPTFIRAASYPLTTALAVTALLASLLLIALRCHKHRGHRTTPRRRTATKGQHRKRRPHRPRRQRSRPRNHHHS